MLNSYNLYIDKLNPDYKESFKKINDYVHANNADEIKNEEILSEVMDSFLEAQSTGKGVDQVTGDLESFCVELCSEIGMRSRIINFVEMLRPMFFIISVFCIMDLGDMIARIPDIEEFNFFTYRGRDSLPGYLLGVLIVFAANYIGKVIAKKYMFSQPEKHKKISFAVTGISVAIVVGGLLYLSRRSGIDEHNGTLLWVTMLCCVVFWVIYRLLTRESRRYKKENRISFGELMLEDIEKEEMKKMSKVNAKRAKKGEAPLSLEDFIEYEKAEINKWYNRPLFHVLLAIVITIAAVGFTQITGGFESVTDIIIFIAIVLSCEAFLMYVMYKATRLWNKYYLQKWVDNKEKEIGK